MTDGASEGHLPSILLSILGDTLLRRQSLSFEPGFSSTASDSLRSEIIPLPALYAAVKYVLLVKSHVYVILSAAASGTNARKADADTASAVTNESNLLFFNLITSYC